MVQDCECLTVDTHTQCRTIVSNIDGLIGRKCVLIIAIHVPAELELAIIIEAGDLLPLGFGLTQGRQQHGGENGDDGNDHQQFDERERGGTPPL